MDIPFLLRAAVTTDRRWAKAIGYALHFVFGLLFAFAYAIFLVIDQSGFPLGAPFGLVHGLFASSALVNVLLPVVHPRMVAPLLSAWPAQLSCLLETRGAL